MPVFVFEGATASLSGLTERLAGLAVDAVAVDDLDDFEKLALDSMDDDCCVVFCLQRSNPSPLEFMEFATDIGREMPLLLFGVDAPAKLLAPVMERGAQRYFELPIDNGVWRTVLGEALAADRAARRAQRRRAAAQSSLRSLTRREMQVLKLVEQGYSNREIARRLELAESTIEMHRKNFMTKLRAGSVAEAVKIAMAARDRSR